MPSTMPSFRMGTSSIMPKSDNAPAPAFDVPRGSGVKMSSMLVANFAVRFVKVLTRRRWWRRSAAEGKVLFIFFVVLFCKR